MVKLIITVAFQRGSSSLSPLIVLSLFTIMHVNMKRYTTLEDPGITGGGG